MTKYAVMWKNGEETYDFVVKELEAHSADSAAEKAAEMISVGGEFLVFPSRNAEEIPVELKLFHRGAVKREALAA